MMQKNYIAGLYLRLSKDDERQGESLSIENQRVILRKYAEERGLSIYDEYIDDGVSGTTFDRPQVKRLLDDAKTGVINTILVKDLSRFGRNYIEVGQYLDYVFPTFGIRFIAIQDNIDTENRNSGATWFIQRRNELSAEQCYVSTILLAYKTGKSLKDTQKLEQRKKSFCNRNGGYPDLRRLFKGKTNKFLEYIDRQNTSIFTYNDYYKACIYLGMDMTETKNIFPHDFKRWHDIRVDQYRTAKAVKDAEERKELYAKFTSVAEKYLSLQCDE